MRKRKGGLVYSTDKGRLCPGCHRAVNECVCSDRSRTGTQDGSVIVSRETKGRKGAGVTLVSGLPLSESALRTLAKTLKSKCGVGGSVKDGIIELQGDQRDKVQSLLETDGYRVKHRGN